MKLSVTLAGNHPKVDAKVRWRAFALLTAMEREFHNLKVEVSDETKSTEAGKNGGLGKTSRKAATKRPK